MSHSTSPLLQHDPSEPLDLKKIASKNNPEPVKSVSKLSFSISRILQPDTVDRQHATENDRDQESNASAEDGDEATSSGSTKNQNSSVPFSITPYRWMMDLPRYSADRLVTVRRVGHPYQSRAPPKHKKPRTSFTKMQIAELENRFNDQKYLASTERASLAKALRMTDAQVKTWFQNRRTKWRRQTAEEREHERQAACKYLLNGSNYLNCMTSPSAYFVRPDVNI